MNDTETCVVCHKTKRVVDVLYISVWDVYLCDGECERGYLEALRDKEVLGTPRNPKDWEIRQVIEKPW